MPSGERIFQLRMSTRRHKGNFYFFIIIQKILHYTSYHSYKYLMYMYHIENFYYNSFLYLPYQRSVWNFFLLFCSLVRNGNIKRSGFYTLQVARVFSNFPRLKQLSKIKKIRLNIVIRDNSKKSSCDYVSFRFLRQCFRVP